MRDLNKDAPLSDRRDKAQHPVGIKPTTSQVLAPRHVLVVLYRFAATAAGLVLPMVDSFFQVERHYQLPTPPSHGHGIVLLTSWSSAFVAENLAFLSMDNEDWWFNLDK